MAPRKSAASAAGTEANVDVSMVSNASATSNTTHAHPKSSRQSGGRQDPDGIGIDDLLLPRTLIQRLARGVLPPNTSLQRDAVLALSKSATVFISYLAHHANEQSTRKTLSPQDVLKALKEIEFANVMDLGAVGKDGRIGGRLERELEVYEEVLMQKRKGAKDRKSNKARESTGTAADGGDEADDDERGEPSNKRARRMEENDDDPDDDDRMLELQLNGVQREDATSQPKSSSTRGKNGGPSPVAKYKGNNETAETESELEADPEDEEEENDDEDEDDDNDQDDDEDDEAQDDEENDEDTDQLEERSASRNRNRCTGLQPNGRTEIVGSDEDSD